MATFVGDSNPNLLLGTPNGSNTADLLEGLEGDDTLVGGDGGDTLDGGGGNDFASYANSASGVFIDWSNPAANTGDASGDQYVSIEGIIGSAFDDRIANFNLGTGIFAGFGNDSVNVVQGGGFVYGGGGNDTLIGNGTTSVGNAAVHDFYGDAGNDLIKSDDGLYTYGGDGNDTIAGGNGPFGGLLLGDAGDDLITVSTVGFAELFGGDGNDILAAQAFDANLYGGEGNDYLYVYNSIGNVTYGGEGNDISIGDVANDLMFGGTGFNYMFGGGGSDTLNGTGGATDADINVMYGGDGNDALYGGIGTNYFYGGAGSDAMYGGLGLNIFISSGETVGNVIYGGSGQNYVYGSNGGDIVTGGTGVDVFLMGAGADDINGGGGTDYAWGGGGSDTFTISDAASEVMVIQDFDTGGVDVLNFSGTSLHSFADVQAAEFYAAGINTTIITDAAGNAAWLIGKAPGDLDPSMFGFS